MCIEMRSFTSSRCCKRWFAAGVLAISEIWCVSCYIYERTRNTWRLSQLIQSSRAGPSFFRAQNSFVSRFSLLPNASFKILIHRIRFLTLSEGNNSHETITIVYFCLQECSGQEKQIKHVDQQPTIHPPQLSFLSPKKSKSVSAGRRLSN